MPVGIHNANTALGIYEPLPDIILDIDTNTNQMLGDYGRSGVMAAYIPEYYEAKGYIVEATYLPSQKEVERAARVDDAVIIYYGNYPNPLSGSYHFMYVDYDSESQSYLIYNEAAISEGPRVERDLSCKYGKYANRVLIAYSINGDNDK